MSEPSINERVAREVMGWTVVRDVRFWDHSQPMPAFVQYAEGRWGVVRTVGSSYEPFNPDSDHNAANAVVEKIRQSLRVDISDIRSYSGWHDGGWKVHFWGESSGVDADPVVAPTLPLAICKAALAAKGATNV